MACDRKDLAASKTAVQSGSFGSARMPAPRGAGTTAFRMILNTLSTMVQSQSLPELSVNGQSFANMQQDHLLFFQYNGSLIMLLWEHTFAGYPQSEHDSCN